MYFQYSTFQKGHNSFKNWRHSNLICSTVKQSKMQNFSSICQSITYILSSQRGTTPSKIDAKWRHSNLIWSTLKQSHVQNFSSICQGMYEKSAENWRTETWTESSQRGITPSKIDAKWRHSILICSTLKQSHVQNFSSIWQGMYEKSAENRRTDGRTDITIP